MRKVYINYADRGFFNTQRKSIELAKEYGFETKAMNVKDLDDEFKTSNSHILSQSRGAGFWIWKPYVILKTLRELSDGDILVYIDCDDRVKKPIDSLFPTDDKGMLVASWNEEWAKQSTWTKGDCFYIFNGKDNPDLYKDVPQVEAGIIFIRKNDFAVKFVKEWLKFCTFEDIVTDAPNRYKENFPDFKDHRHDQSILSFLVYKYNINRLTNFEEYFERNGSRD